MIRSGVLLGPAFSAASPLSATSTWISPPRSSVCLIRLGDVLFVFDDQHARLGGRRGTG